MADTPKSFFLTKPVHEYLLAHAPPLDDLQRDLIAETEKLGGISMMQIAPEQGAFMGVLTRLIGARHAIEVGTFTGYSSLCIARGLAPGGSLLCCDVSEEWTAIGRRAWERAGVPYAVAGGNAVAAWVTRVDESAVRNTRDVDILIRRADLPAATAVLESAGFVYRHSAGVDVFLDGALRVERTDASAEHGCRVDLAGSDVRCRFRVASGGIEHHAGQLLGHHVPKLPHRTGQLPVRRRLGPVRGGQHRFPRMARSRHALGRRS